MRPESLAIITFLVSVVSYGRILQDTRIPAIGMVAFIGAIGTAFAVYAIERHYSIPKARP